MIRETQLPALMTVKEAAEYLHISVWTIRRWAKDNVLKHVRIGKEYRIVRDSLPKSPIPEKNFDKP
jgi:excisionase family DNA binding protein